MFDYTQYVAFKLMQQDSWASQYDPYNRFSVDPHAYDAVEDYLDALREEWLDAVDLPDELVDEIDVNDYTDFESFEEAIEEYLDSVREEWLEAVDIPEELEDEIDVNDYTDFESFEEDEDEY